MQGVHTQCFTIQSTVECLIDTVVDTIGGFVDKCCSLFHHSTAWNKAVWQSLSCVSQRDTAIIHSELWYTSVYYEQDMSVMVM